MTDFSKPYRQQVRQETTNKLKALERHHFGAVIIGVVFISEGHASSVVVQREQTTVADGHAVSIAT